MGINELFAKFQADLRGVELNKITDAQKFIYKNLLKSIVPERNDDWLVDFLNGNLIKHPQKVVLDFVKLQKAKRTSASNFRNFSFENKNEHEIDLLKKKIAYYWTIIMTTYPKVSITISNSNPLHPIIIDFENEGTIFPFESKKEVEEYIGFYPRSKADFADRFGIVHLKTSLTLKEEVNKGAFTMKAFYKTYLTTVSGRYREEDRITYLRTNDDEKGTHTFYEKQSTLSSEEMNSIILTQFIWHKSDHQKDYVLGVISTVNRKSKFAFSGACVFLKKSYYEKTFANDMEIDDTTLKNMAIGKKDIPPIISYYLWGQRISTNFTEFTKGEFDLPFSDQVIILSKISGIYSYYYITNDETNHISLIKTIVEIKDNGLVIFDEDDDTKNGFIRFIKSNNIVGRYNLILYIGIDENKLYHQQYIALETYSESEKGYMLGSFTIGGDHPDSGKILFYKEVNPSNLKVGTKENCQFNTVNEDISNYFIKNNSYLSGYTLNKRNRDFLLPAYLPEKLSLFTTLNENEEGDLQNLENTYLLHMPLSLNSNGFNLKKNHNSAIGGKLEINDFKFILKANDSLQNEIIYISLPSPIKSSDFEYATGIMTFFKNNGKVESRQVIITKRINADFYAKNYSSTKSATIPEESLAYKYLYLYHPTPRLRSLDRINGKF